MGAAVPPGRDERFLVPDRGRLAVFAREMAQPVACNHNALVSQRGRIDHNIQGQRILDERRRGDPHR